MKHHLRKLFIISVLVLGSLCLSLYPQTLYNCTSSILGHFNATPIPPGSSIWFSAYLTSSGTPTSPATISVNQYMITFGQQVNGLPYQCHNYPPVNSITFFNPPGEAQLTYFDSANFWKESVPLQLGGRTFLAACTIPPCASGQTFDCVLPGGLPGSLPVTWTMQFQSTVTQPISWQWGAAVYSQFAPCKVLEECQSFGALGIKAVDNQNPSQSCVDGTTNCLSFANSDNAGTPENFKQFVIGGGTGAGGSNYTGSSSATGTCTPVSSPCQASLSGSCRVNVQSAEANEQGGTRPESQHDAGH